MKVKCCKELAGCSLPLADPVDTASSGCLPTVMISCCRFPLWEMCQILIVPVTQRVCSFWRRTVTLLHCHRWSVRATHSLGHPCKCSILLSLSLMKSHKPFPSPSLHLRPLTICHPFSILGQQSVSAEGLTDPCLSQERWAVPWQSQVLHLSSGLFINLTAASWDCLHGSEATENNLTSAFLFFSLSSFHRGFATLSSDEELAYLEFLKQGLQFFQQQGWSLTSAIFREIKTQRTSHTNSMFGSRLIFQPLMKISLTLSTTETQCFKGQTGNVV